MHNWSQEQIRDFKIIEVNNPIIKKVHLVLVGVDGNAFNLLGLFKTAAKKAKWTEQEIEYVIWRATSGDYNKLLSVLMEHSDDPFGEESGDVIYVNGETYKKI